MDSNTPCPPPVNCLKSIPEPFGTGAAGWTVQPWNSLGFVSWIGGKSFIAAPSLADGSCHARPTDPPAPPDSVQPFITNSS